jgi:hypothetical protein
MSDSGTANAPRHLVAVWNPSYEEDALDLHASLLLELARDGTTSPDDVYVWWGRVRSPNRQQPLPHTKDVLALDSETDSRELHLYLTDYRSLYVALVNEISDDADVASDRNHVPAYYGEKELKCDFWFQLADIRALVIDDTLAVQHELQQLRVVTYHNRPVSLYGGMVDLPLIVTRADGRSFFSENERAQLNDGALWVEMDSDRHGLGGLMADLRDNLFGDSVWMSLEPAVRSFVATGERLMRDHRRDPGFDFSAVLIELSKAVEVQVNATLGRVLRTAPEPIRFAHVDGATLDLSRGAALTLGQLARVIPSERARFDWIATNVVHGRWFTEQLPPMLDQLARFRNRGAHSERLARESAVKLRGDILGVGSAGILCDLTKVKRR